MSTPASVLEGHYEPVKVFLSVVLAMLGAFCAIELAARTTAARGRARVWWLIGGGIATGIGTWSMHYMGMFAFVLPVPIQYHWPTALVSYLTSFFGGVLALHVVSRPTMGMARAVIGSIFMGAIGISGQHYCAMASMRLNAAHDYSTPGVALSVFVAIGLSLASLWQMFIWRDISAYNLRKILSGILLGAAIPAMHYTGMAAVIFRNTGEVCDPTGAVTISKLGVLSVMAVNILVVIVVGLVAMTDRLRQNTALLDELFDKAPQPVALLDPENRVVRVNDNFTRVFGYSAPEAIGQSIDQLIVPEALRDREETYRKRIRQGERVEAEEVVQRKDGSSLPVAMVRVPVQVTPGKVLVYSLYQDISAAKESEAALRDSNAQLHDLSRRIFKVQEEEKRHLARELHDEMGQTLTAAKISLQSARSAAILNEAQQRIDDSIVLLDQLVQQARQLSLDLRPPLLDDLGLMPALRWYLDQTAQRASLRLDFFADPNLPRLPYEIETACFRVVQEAVTNVVRHAGADSVSVELDVTPEALHLIVRDNGRGFDVPTTLGCVAEGKCLGLAGMRERVSLVGGEFDLKSQPGQGTELHAFFPLQLSATAPTSSQ